VIKKKKKKKVCGWRLQVYKQRFVLRISLQDPNTWKALGFEAFVSGSRLISGFGFRGRGSGFEVPCFGLRVPGSGF